MLKNMCECAREEIVDAKYNMVELVDLAWGRGASGGNDVDDHPTPIVEHPQAHEYAQLLSNCVVGHPLELSNVNVMNMQSFVNKLNIQCVMIFNVKYEHTYIFP
jgi:hypothetical protein